MEIREKTKTHKRVDRTNEIFCNMKKFILNLFNVVATAKDVKGKKSAGKEDCSTFKHWKSLTAGVS